MSNAQVGTVYSQIIHEVVEASRVDVEEGGIDESVLDELRVVSHSLFSFLFKLSFKSLLLAFSMGSCLLFLFFYFFYVFVLEILVSFVMVLSLLFFFSFNAKALCLAG